MANEESAYESSASSPQQPISDSGDRGDEGATPAAGSWESLPEWFREHYDRYGADQISDHGWHKLLATPSLPVAVRGRSLIWVGEGPEYGAELAYRAAPLPDAPAFDPDDLDAREAWLQARGEDVGELRRLGLLPTPCRLASDPEFDPDGVEYLNPPRDRSYDD